MGRNRKREIISIPNSVLQQAIDEWGKGSREREMLHLYWIDGLTYDELAERYNLSYQRVKDIIRVVGDHVLIKAQEMAAHLISNQ